MNRELKFRAFYQKKLYMQEYCGGFSYFIHNDSDALTLEDIFVAAERQKCIIQQYTGLKDKNGKEIYEGDICNAGMMTGPIDFIIGGFSLASNPLIEFLPKDACIFSPDYDPSWIDVEVIGNVFENPELLK